MLTKSPPAVSPAGIAFPAAEVRRRLMDGVQTASADDATLEGSWDLPLDSLSLIAVLATLEELFKFPLPPERLVQRGGYNDVETGVGDMFNRLESLWRERQTAETST